MIKNTSPPLGSEPPTIDGFTFVRPIGSGSTANVYLYRQLDRNRPVAVKVGNVARHPQASARIAHEAHILGLLPQHPHILPLLAMGTAGPGLNYLVFEYASGGNCHSLLRTRETSCADMLRLGVKLADALCAVHRAGIVHRDIKPGNVLITAAGEPVLADFGTACNVYGADDACYSIPWSAPESLAHRKPCEGTDMYSLAALLYALLAGASPFEYGYRPRSSAQLRSIILSQPVPRSTARTFLNPSNCCCGGQWRRIHRTDSPPCRILHWSCGAQIYWCPPSARCSPRSRKHPPAWQSPHRDQPFRREDDPPRGLAMQTGIGARLGAKRLWRHSPRFRCCCS